MNFNYKDKQITGLELLDILENKSDPFTYKELAEYKNLVTKALAKLRAGN